MTNSSHTIGATNRFPPKTLGAVSCKLPPVVRYGAFFPRRNTVDAADSDSDVLLINHHGMRIITFARSSPPTYLGTWSDEN